MHKVYRARNKDMQILLNNSQAGPGTAVKKKQEEICHTHVQAFIPGSVFCLDIAMQLLSLVAFNGLPMINKDAHQC